MGADVDDARMRAGAEDDQPEITHVRHQHALVHQQRIGHPGGIGAGPAEVIDAALFERRDARNLATVIIVVVEQEPGLGPVDHLRAMLLQLGWARDIGDGNDHSVLQPDRALVEHPRIDVDGDVSALPHDCVDRIWERRHVVPMAVRHRNGFDLAQANAEIGAIADEGRAFRAGVEQHGMLNAIDLGDEPQAKSQVCVEQRRAGNDLCPGKNDIRELGDREQGLADIGVADVVGHHFHDEGIEGSERGRVGHGRIFQCGGMGMKTGGSPGYFIRWRIASSSAPYGFR